MDIQSRKKIFELLLWMTDKPLKIPAIQNILGEGCPPEAELREELAAVGKDLDERESPLQLMEVAQGFQLASRPAYSPWVRRLFKEKTTLRLSPSSLETLSIVAYKQPITRGEIEQIRGVDAGGVLDNLLERKMIKIVGRKEALGRPLLYGTTVEFMRQFGLKSLSDMPKLEELVPPEELAAGAPSSVEAEAGLPLFDAKAGVASQESSSPGGGSLADIRVPESSSVEALPEPPAPPPMDESFSSTPEPEAEGMMAEAAPEPVAVAAGGEGNGFIPPEDSGKNL